jgi:hypothetical protein
LNDQQLPSISNNKQQQKDESTSSTLNEPNVKTLYQQKEEEMIDYERLNKTY